MYTVLHKNMTLILLIGNEHYVFPDPECKFDHPMSMRLSHLDRHLLYRAYLEKTIGDPPELT